MTREYRRTVRDSILNDKQTRRRFLQLTGLGSVGIAGCTRFGPGGTDTPTDPLSTLFATWRGRDPTSTITLQWLTATDERSDPVSVDVSQENGEDNVMTQTDVASFGESHLSRHRAILTELESDTRYRVSVDESDTGLFVRTAPEELTDSLTFAEGGDIGTSSDVPQLHEQAANWDPLFALVGGDLAYADGHDSDRWITFLEHWNEYMRSGDRLIPLVAAIGNHEVRGGMNESPAEAPFFYTLFDNPFRDHAYWALDVGEDVSILILDSNHTTDVSGAQTEWLEAAVAERTDREHLMAAYHVPIYPSVRSIEERGRDEMRQHWVPLLDEYEVDVAFEHDDHAYKRTHPLRDGVPDTNDGILYLGDGGWGRGTRDVHSPDERPYLAVSESELHVIAAELVSDGSQQFQAINPVGEIIDQSERSRTQLEEQFITTRLWWNRRRPVDNVL